MDLNDVIANLTSSEVGSIEKNRFMVFASTWRRRNPAVDLDEARQMFNQLRNELGYDFA